MVRGSLSRGVAGVEYATIAAMMTATRAIVSSQRRFLDEGRFMGRSKCTRGGLDGRGAGLLSRSGMSHFVPSQAGGTWGGRSSNLRDQAERPLQGRPSRVAVR